MKTRREFLHNCSTLIAAAVLAPIGAVGKPNLFEMKDIPLDDLRFEALAGQLTTAFRVCVGETRAVELELVEANLEPSGGKGGRKTAEEAGYERFSLIFRGSRSELLGQQIHRFEHDGIGRFELFIVPVVSRDTSRAYYEAVFNRPIKAQ